MTKGVSITSKNSDVRSSFRANKEVNNSGSQFFDQRISFREQISDIDFKEEESADQYLLEDDLTPMDKYSLNLK